MESVKRHRSILISFSKFEILDYFNGKVRWLFGFKKF